MTPCPRSLYLWKQFHLDQNPAIEVLNRSVYSRPLCSGAASSPAGHSDNPEEVSAVVFAHEWTPTVTLQRSRED